MLRCYRHYGADPYYGNSAWHCGYYGNGYDNANRHNNGYNSSGYNANSYTHNTNLSGNTVNVNNANRQNTSADRSNFSDASRGRGQNGSGREATAFSALVIMDWVVAAVGEIAQPVRVAGQAAAAAAVAVVAASAGAASVAVVSEYNSGDISWMPAEVQQKTWQDNDNDKVSALEGEMSHGKVTNLRCWCTPRSGDFRRLLQQSASEAGRDGSRIEDFASPDDASKRDTKARWPSVKPFSVIRNAATAALTPALYPIYVRGRAYLAAQRGSGAAAEFEKILKWRGVVQNQPIAPLARLGMARLYFMQGDTAKAKPAPQDFLALWNDADSDIPILVQVKSEYAKLR